jgi:Type IV secretion system pilin
MLMHLLSYFAACSTDSTIFGIPTWYKYLEVNEVLVRGIRTCQIQADIFKDNTLDLTVALLIGFGILDILLRIGALVAVGFIMYAGVQYVSAQGEPDKAKKALGTIINALVGLGITIVAAAAVAFVGNRIGAAL